VRRTASRRLLLFLLAVLLLAPLWVPQAGRLYRESPLSEGHLRSALTACAQGPTSEAAFLCYREAVREAARAKGPKWAAGACARVGDPLCFEAFGQEAPDDTWCAYAREHGWFAYKACLVATCRK
jgi:hypothetical protein